MNNKEVLFFTSKKCVACKDILPRLKNYCGTNIKINIIDVEENPQIVNNYCVSSLPTLIYMFDTFSGQKSRNPKRQLTGSVSDDLLKEWIYKDE